MVCGDLRPGGGADTVDKNVCMLCDMTEESDNTKRNQPCGAIPKSRDQGSRSRVKGSLISHPSSLISQDNMMTYGTSRARVKELHVRRVPGGTSAKPPRRDRISYSGYIIAKIVAVMISDVYVR